LPADAFVPATLEVYPGPQLVRRHFVLSPGLCGHNSLLVGHVGDWTWDAAARFCGASPYAAQTPDGAPTYLSFCYYQIRAVGGAHLRTYTIGDAVEAQTRAFACGRNALHTLHRIRPCATAAEMAAPSLELSELHEPPGSEPALYFETYNRWVARSDGDSNERLIKAAPAGFSTLHLSETPAGWQPRNFFQPAIEAGTFRANALRAGLARDTATFSWRYDVNPARDINGVGLLYFAAYFSIVDDALLHVWSMLGGSTNGFIERQVTRQSIVFLANADSTAQLDARCTLQRIQQDELAFDVVLQRRHDQTTIAICTVWLKANDSELTFPRVSQ
jgi:probable biosynthetic protein (TIGR04098 family)